ncbi:MAG: acyltransferase [Bacteroidales bacterium]|nr:acyltransferase [Bacteroidales bacterium]
MKPPVSQVFKLSSEKNFEEAAMEIFRFQAVNNPVYSRWINELGVDYQRVEGINEIPFLPVSAFINHKVLVAGPEAEKVFLSSGTTGSKRSRHKVAGLRAEKVFLSSGTTGSKRSRHKVAGLRAEKVFLSSGTTGSKRSRHYVADPAVYEQSFTQCFRIFYGEPSDYVILALLPSYLEREGSSLVYMANGLIRLSASPLSGFFLDDYPSLEERIKDAGHSGRKIILLGVSFALLDFAEHTDISLKNHIVMETGGMKGRRREMTREELHSVLGNRFELDSIHSEYGMTELLSQAYSKGGGLYKTPPWMKVLIRDPRDPFDYFQYGRTGGVNIIDLANIYSCSFIETSDLGIAHPDGSFEIVGRFDNSDIRGCNLMTI